MAVTQVDVSCVGLTDDELVRGVRARNEDAVRELTRRYNRRLFRIARGILRNDSEAEDVVQETWVCALTGLDGFRGDAAFATWITRIAMNDALMRIRQRKPVVIWPDGGDEPLRAHILQFPSASSSADPETTMANREMRAMIEHAIDELPDAFRAVFVARMVEGLSVEDTAELFGLKPETVKTRVHRARARLRTSLEARFGSVLGDAFPFDGERCGRMTEAVVARVLR